MRPVGFSWWGKLLIDPHVFNHHSEVLWMNEVPHFLRLVQRRCSWFRNVTTYLPRHVPVNVSAASRLFSRHVSYIPVRLCDILSSSVSSFFFFFSLSLASNLLYGRKSLRGLFKRLKRKHSVWFSRMFIHFMRKKKKCFHWRHILWVLHVIIWMHLLWMSITGFYTWFLTGIVVKIETFPSFKMFSDVL